MEKTQDNYEVHNNAVNFYMPQSLVPKSSFRPKTQSDRLKVKETPILIQFTLFFLIYSLQQTNSMVLVTWVTCYDYNYLESFKGREKLST